ncbi:hypothetical protein T439DRAFT_44895 [Meredithblackwellia eburnea MCA 4105]
MGGHCRVWMGRISERNGMGWGEWRWASEAVQGLCEGGSDLGVSVHYHSHSFLDILPIPLCLWLLLLLGWLGWCAGGLRRMEVCEGVKGAPPRTRSESGGGVAE